MNIKDLFPNAKTRKEREEQIAKLVEQANHPASAIVITMNHQTLDYGFIGRLEPVAALRALELVRDDIIKLMAQQEHPPMGPQPEPPLPGEEPQAPPGEPGSD